MGKTANDAKLLRLEAEFNAASDRWNKATARTARLEKAIDRLRSRREKAEKKEAKKAGRIALMDADGMTASPLPSGWGSANAAFTGRWEVPKANRLGVGNRHI